MDATERNELVRIALEVAEEAAAYVMRGYRTDVSPTEKGRADLVTEHDLASERLIRERLAERTPEIAIVGEEQGGEAGDGPTWYCDPIDGTTNFVHGHPFFCVSVGLFDAGQALLGAVVAPALDVRWHGVVGQGAYRNDEPCGVSDTSELAHALVGTGFHPKGRGRPPHDNLGSWNRVMPRVRDLRRCGSAALDLCLVADGTYDAYWERTLNAWDVIGGAAICLAAGGRITGLEGQPADLRIGHIVASNGRIHDALVAAL